MKEDQIAEIKKMLIEVLRKHGVKKAALFGSIVRDCSKRHSGFKEENVKNRGRIEMKEVEFLIKRAMKYLKSANFYYWEL